MKRPLGSWPLLSGPNKDGSSHIGIRVLPDAARQLEDRGHIVANKMYERSVDRAVVAGVRVGDVLDVRAHQAAADLIRRSVVLEPLFQDPGPGARTGDSDEGPVESVPVGWLGRT